MRGREGISEGASTDKLEIVSREKGECSVSILSVNFFVAMFS